MSSSPASVSGSSLSSLDTKLKNMLQGNEYGFNLASFWQLAGVAGRQMPIRIRDIDQGR